MTTPDFLKEIETVQAEAELLYSAAEVDAAINRMATEITSRLSEKNPVVICLMVGAVIPVGLLMPKLNFPLQIDYVHATRYQGNTSGGEIAWVKSPDMDIKGRCVLIVDDILDEGITLASMMAECKKLNAAEIYTAVLVDKNLGKPRPFEKADFTGLTIPNRYVFGYGMDYKDYLRNAPGIYAVKGL
ncbi:MAG: hypoxanthine-guanine phosphoribosyltransferase [Gammaproteobacteria bacterium RIFCSPLOWO2_12_FULL_47_76]|nr:MAG: hypoxanthine-guanine phosphoribosyltransferase [Gammaproteobacteria bacterium RIFCSPLOWO2_12_FULL_47_76]